MSLNDLSLTAEQLEQAAGLYRQMEDCLAGLTALTGKDRQRLTKSSSRSLGFIRYAAEVARTEPQHCPASFDRELFLTESALWEPMMILQTNLHQLSHKLDAATQVLGGNLMHRAGEFYGVLKVSQRSHPELQEHVRNLGRLYRRPTESAGAIAPETTAAPEQG